MKSVLHFAVLLYALNGGNGLLTVVSALAFVITFPLEKKERLH